MLEKKEHKDVLPRFGFNESYIPVGLTCENPFTNQRTNYTLRNPHHSQRIQEETKKEQIRKLYSRDFSPKTWIEGDILR